MRKNSEKINFIQEYFDEILPNARCVLYYKKDYELLLSIMLSAQCTDVKVNKVVEPLFNKYENIDSLLEVSQSDYEIILSSLGMQKMKSKNFVSILNKLKNEYNYVVPKDKEKLIEFDGVGNKTANVFLAEFYKIPQFPVDTHVNRVSKRLGLASENDDVIKVEEALKKQFPKENWIKLHHQFIWFGREICSARNPKCDKCKLCKYCTFYKR